MTTLDTLSAGPIFDAAGLAYVATSLTTYLSDGHLKNFYRIMANDYYQEVATRELISQLPNHGKVLIIGDLDPYSLDQTRQLVYQLRNAHISFRVVNVPIGQKDQSAITKADTRGFGTVVLTHLHAADALLAVAAVQAGGRRPILIANTIVGVDISQFGVSGAYVTQDAPNIQNMPKGQAITRVYQQVFSSVAPFSASTDVAMQVVATAALQTCHNGVASRAGVLRVMPSMKLPDTVLYPVAFTPNHELVGGRYYVYQIEGNQYVDVPLKA
jgi:ABC-type branched-subunit amino acid transport system substrate-binding protein